MAEDDTRRNYDIKSRVFGSVLRFWGARGRLSDFGVCDDSARWSVRSDGLKSPPSTVRTDAGWSAVVVRWRMADLQRGRLLGRGLLL